MDPAWNAGACLEWIERAELFLIPLDDQREWYRYHHLFQESLQQKLAAEMAPAEVNQLHLRAAAWFEAQGLIDEAMHHALAAGDLDLAAAKCMRGCAMRSTERTADPERRLSLHGRDDPAKSESC
jgi:LuxR family maltose regulon positive regulatory protein